MSNLNLILNNFDSTHSHLVGKMRAAITKHIEENSYEGSKVNLDHIQFTINKFDIFGTTDVHIAIREDYLDTFKEIGYGALHTAHVHKGKHLTYDITFYATRDRDSSFKEMLKYIK